ncbi:hypothetical protein BX616_003878 [Lobosporangium transversale]|nr:hypothetical protein BX616_003878 [Lobosporangium transversale]
MGFLPTESKGAIGGLDTSVEARKALAIKSRTWSCPTCQSENISILPDVAPENAVKASLKADELPPEFSFGYEADKKKQAEESDSNNNTNKNEACEDKGNLAESAVEYLPSPSSTGFTPTMSDDIQSSRPAIELESTVRPMHQSSIQQQQGPSAGVQSSSNVPQGLSRPLTPVTGASSSSTTTEIRARTGAATSQSQTQILEHLQAPAQARAQNNRRTESGIPVWLDTLIFIFGGLLVAMVIRKFI